MVRTTFPQPPDTTSGPLSFSTSVFGKHLPTSYPILQTIWPNRVPYQHILFLHQLFVFLSVALTHVVPKIISLSSREAADSRQLEPFELATWERIYGTLAVADREASILLHTILQSIHPTSRAKGHHEPSLASMQPLSQEETRETLDILTPEMHAMVVETNIKNHMSNPIQAAWKSALTATSKQESIVDEMTPTVDEKLPRTPNSLWDEDSEEQPFHVGSPSRSRSGSPTLRQAKTKAEDANETQSPSPGRSSCGPSAGEF